MKRTARLLALLLVCAMLSTLLSVTAFAAADDVYTVEVVNGVLTVYKNGKATNITREVGEGAKIIVTVGKSGKLLIGVTKADGEKLQGIGLPTGDADIEVKGDLGELQIQSKVKSDITVASDAKVNKLVTNGQGAVAVEGTVNNLEAAGKAEVTVASGANVQNVALNGSAAMKAESGATLGEVKVGSKDASFDAAAGANVSKVGAVEGAKVSGAKTETIQSSGKPITQGGQTWYPSTGDNGGGGSDPQPGLNAANIMYLTPGITGTYTMSKNANGTEVYYVSLVGNNVKPGTDFTGSLFPGVENRIVAGINIKNLFNAGVNYVVQENPALAIYPNDSRIHFENGIWVKRHTYASKPAVEDLELMVGPGYSSIKVTRSDSASSVPTKIYNISSNITFAPPVVNNLPAGITATASYNAATKTVTIDLNGTAQAQKDITKGIWDTDLFGAAKPGIAAVTMKILPASGTFRVVQTNPALEAYKEDDRITDVAPFVKTADYTADGDMELSIPLKSGQYTVNVAIVPASEIPYLVTNYIINCNLTIQ